MILQIVGLILFLIWMYLNNSGKIPGPWNFPFCGSAPMMLVMDLQMMSYPYRVMHSLANKYGNVMKVGLGTQDWYVLSGFKEIQEFSMSENSISHLPSKTFDEIYSFDRPLGIIFPDGGLWRDQRKFGLKTLRQLGVGKSTLEDKMLVETTKLMEHIQQIISTQGKVVRMDDLFDLPCLNIIWGLVNATRFEYSDQHLKNQIKLINQFTMESFIGPLVALRFLKYVPPVSLVYNRVKQSMDVFKQYIRDIVSSERGEFSEDDPKGYVDHFFIEEDKTETSYYEEEQLIVTLIDFFTGGSGTMSKTLAFGLLYSVLYPEVADKVRAELDQQTGEQSVVTLEDKDRLPYTEATIAEISRLASVLPIAPPRKTTGDIKVGDFTLPAGSLVQMNLYSLHRNLEHWVDPHTFRPERFIKDGLFVQDEWVQPFGYGKRKCLGESIARNNTFLMYANIMRKFLFLPSPQHPLPSTEPIGGLTIGPQPFQVLVELRG